VQKKVQHLPMMKQVLLVDFEQCIPVLSKLLALLPAGKQ